MGLLLQTIEIISTMLFLHLFILVYLLVCLPSSNLSFDTEEEDMFELFSELGEVVYCRMTMDTNSGRSKGQSVM